MIFPDSSVILPYASMNTFKGAFSYSYPGIVTPRAPSAPILPVLPWAGPAVAVAGVGSAVIAACGGRTENRLIGGLTNPLPIIYITIL